MPGLSVTGSFTVVLALLLPLPKIELTLRCARYVSELSIVLSVDRYILRNEVVEAPGPRFATVFDIDTLTPVRMLEGALMELTTRSTPLVTAIAPDTALLFVSSLSTLVLVSSAIAPI